MRQAVNNDFLDVVYGDSDLLRLDFDELMSQEWPAGDLPHGSTPGVLRYFSRVQRRDADPALPVCTPPLHRRRWVPIDVLVSERGPPQKTAAG